MADIENDAICQTPGCNHPASMHADTAQGKNTGSCQAGGGCDCAGFASDATDQAKAGPGQGQPGAQAPAALPKAGPPSPPPAGNKPPVAKAAQAGSRRARTLARRFVAPPPGSGPAQDPTAPPPDVPPAIDPKETAQAISDGLDKVATGFDGADPGSLPPVVRQVDALVDAARASITTFLNSSGDDANDAAQATDAAVDSALDLLASGDAGSLPDDVNAALEQLNEVDNMNDALLDALGLIDPDEGGGVEGEEQSGDDDAPEMVAAEADETLADDKPAPKGTIQDGPMKGSFPINNAADLQRAIQAVGRAKDPARAKKHIKQRAKDLGLVGQLPDSYKDSVEEPEQLAADDEPKPAEAAPEAEGPTDSPPSIEVEEGSQRFSIPIGILEGIDTGDGRRIAPQALTWRTPPLPVMAQLQTLPEHLEAELVARVDSLERFDASALINPKTQEPYGEDVWGIRAEGVFTTQANATLVASLIREGFLRGVSADIGDVTVELEMPEGDEGGDLDEGGFLDLLMGGGDVTEVLTGGRIMGFTVCPFPAFEGAYIQLEDGTETPQLAEPVPVTSSGGEILRRSFRIVDEAYERTCRPCEDGLVASASAPMYPPREWFTMPEPDKLTPITLTDDGRFYGHLASWKSCHTGVNGKCTLAPKSRMDYGMFHTGALKTAEGDVIPIGNVTLGTGHAPLSMSMAAALEHYDNTGTVVADVQAYDGRHGIWLCGALRPELTELQIRQLRASGLSGDWRGHGGHLELMAALAVNVQGFPIARARVASGAPTAMVATGGRDVIAHVIEQSDAQQLANTPQLQFVEGWVKHLVDRQVAALRADIHGPRVAALRAELHQPFEDRAADLRASVHS